MIFVGNASGSFALWNVDSRYRGVFFWEKGQMFRAIANISGGKWSYGKEVAKRTDAEAWFAHRLPVFCYESAKPSEVLLDCKINYDNRVWGRYYDFAVDNKTVLVHFQKRDDAREEKKGEYEFWLAFHGCEFTIINEWIEEQYSFDEDRNSAPFSRYVLKGLKANGSFVVAGSTSKSNALKLARDAWNRKAQLKTELKQATKTTGSKIKKMASYSLQCLEADSGLFAGLPWFHQRWARDELISVKGLLLAGNVSLAKAIVFDWLNKLTRNGKLPGTLTHRVADSGWVFVRCEDLLPHLTMKEKRVVRKKVNEFLGAVQNNLDNGLVANSERETWMDSIDRSGSRIEINALVLAACRLAGKVGESHSLEQQLAEEVQTWFWTGKYLKDGVSEDTFRSNVFIAAYAYPELLSPEEWEQCFDTMLPRLWCAWGGISSLDKRHECFVPEHSGEVAASYHNGDSWFWINNVAAIVLMRLNKKKYAKYIAAIRKAGEKDLLNGAVGHCSELSSARKQTQSGSPVQAWSAATFLELLAER